MAETLKPQDEDELAGLIADRAAARRPVRIAGGGTRQIGNPVEAADTLSTAAIAGVVDYEPGSLTIIVRSGTPLADVEELLAAQNQQLPFEPPRHGPLFGAGGASTMGGVVAAAAAGPRAIQAGGARDSLIGIRMVTGEGVAIKNGGRVMKNVTGYDLVKLAAGAQGTLGVLTELSFKVLPRPETAATVRLGGVGPRDGVAALSKVLASPFDVSGAAYVSAARKDGAAALVRVEGFADSVAYRSAQLAELLARDVPADATVTVETAPDEVSDTWRRIGDVADFAPAGSNGDMPASWPALWKAVLKPSHAPDLIERLEGTFAFDFLLDRGGGLVWIAATEATGADARAELAAHRAVRTVTGDLGGHATLVRASDALRGAVDAFHPMAERLARISQSLRRRFDPAGILNPGLMGRETA